MCVCVLGCVGVHRLWLYLHSTKAEVIFNPLWYIQKTSPHCFCVAYCATKA